jgi:Putative peptidoglycan binding domain/L,D-transpeptidase catalytic domain
VLGALLLGVSTVLMTSSAAAAEGDALTVKEVQTRLRDLHCYSGSLTGDLDPRTRAAVINFQAANHLEQTGRLSPATREALSAKDPVPCDDRPVPRRSGTGRRIVVSQKQNYVWVVRASGAVAAQGPMTDNPDVLQPGGYHTGSYCGRPARVRHNTDYSGNWRLDYFVRFAPCGIGFHAIPVSYRDGSLIEAPWKLGTDQATSHGCIRVTNGLAREIWDFTDNRRTKVVVR